MTIAFYSLPTSSLNLNLWTTELEGDLDKEFFLDGVTFGLQLLPKDSSLVPVEMNNYNSVLNPEAVDKVEATIIEEIADGNYVVSPTKPIIVSALGAVPKPDSDELRIIHDCPCHLARESIHILK